MKQVFTLILAFCLTLSTASLAHANEKDKVRQELEKIQEDKSSIKKDLDQAGRRNEEITGIRSERRKRK